MAQRIAAQWFEKPLKTIDVQSKLLYFYKALQKNITVGYKVLRLWTQITPSLASKTLHESYPKTLPPLKIYLQNMSAWEYRLRNNLRYFVDTEKEREEHRLWQLAEKWRLAKQIALQIDPQLAGALFEFAGSFVVLDQTWKRLHQNPQPTFVKENRHVDLMPNFIHKLPDLKKWAYQMAQAV